MNWTFFWHKVPKIFETGARMTKMAFLMCFFGFHLQFSDKKAEKFHPAGFGLLAWIWVPPETSQRFFPAERLPPPPRGPEGPLQQNAPVVTSNQIFLRCWMGRGGGVGWGMGSGWKGRTHLTPASVDAPKKPFAGVHNLRLASQCGTGGS